MSLGPGVELGPYSVVERIGRGGMATVYKAHHPELDRYVAIKVLPDFFAEGDGYRERFQEEARAVARLDHPNIVGVHDAGCEEGRCWVAYQLVSGRPLWWYRDRQPMDAATAALLPSLSVIWTLTV